MYMRLMKCHASPHVDLRFQQASDVVSKHAPAALVLVECCISWSEQQFLHRFVPLDIADGVLLATSAQCFLFKRFGCYRHCTLLSLLADFQAIVPM
jgi:hypothetical protein